MTTRREIVFFSRKPRPGFRFAIFLSRFELANRRSNNEFGNQDTRRFNQRTRWNEILFGLLCVDSLCTILWIEKEKSKESHLSLHVSTDNALLVKIVPFNREGIPKIDLENCANYNGNKKERVSFDAKDEIEYLNIRTNTYSVLLRISYNRQVYVRGYKRVRSICRSTRFSQC